MVVYRLTKKFGPNWCCEPDQQSETGGLYGDLVAVEAA